MHAQGALVRRWRPRIFVQATLWLLAAGFVGCGVVAFLTAGPLMLRVGVATPFLAYALVSLLHSTSRIDLYDERLVLKGIRRRPRVVPIEDVRAVVPGYYGLTLRTGPYSSVSGPGLIGYKSRLTRWAGLKSRGDRIAAVIMERAEAYRALHPDTRPEVVRVVEDLVATLRWAGRPGEATWLEGRVGALGSPDEPTRTTARRELREVAAGGLGEIYLGTNRAFFDDRLSRLAALTADGPDLSSDQR